MDYGESLEEAVVREAVEETGLEIKITEQFHAYSDPSRDPRHHTVSVVFIAESRDDRIPEAMDDAADVGIFRTDSLPEPVAFDHGRILSDYIRYRKGESRKEIFG